MLPAQVSVTNVPLSATPGDPFMWSFDRVVAGGSYAERAVQPVLHRYNDAKYVWDDASARAWLQGFVRAHGGVPVVIDLAAEEGTISDVPIDLEGVPIEVAQSGGAADAPIVLE